MKTQGAFRRYQFQWLRRVCVFSLLVCFLLSTGCGNIGGEEDELDQSTGSITGTVLNAATLARLAGAQVVATQDGEPVGADITDVNGGFTMEKVPPGITALVASLGNAASAQLTVNVVAGRTTTDVVLAIAVPPQARAFVLTTDGGTGSFATINLDTRIAIPNMLLVGNDPQVRFFHNFAYVVNRAPQNTIQVLNAQNNFTLARQFTTGNGSNPHDIALVSAEKAYVTRYDLRTLLVVNPSAGQSLNEIDLSRFADADGIPEMDQMLIVGNRLFISAQRLNPNNLPTGMSLLIIIDTITDQVLGSIELTGTNPVTQLLFDQPNNRMLVGEAGDPFLLDGGIDAIDLATNRASGFVVNEAALGGEISAMVLLSDTKGYAVVQDNVSQLVSFNPRTGTRLGVLLTTPGLFLSALAINDRDELFVGDRTPASPGVRIVNTITDRESTVVPINVGFPPAGAPNALFFFSVSE
jgi:hypothetical protein